MENRIAWKSDERGWYQRIVPLISCYRIGERKHDSLPKSRMLLVNRKKGFNVPREFQGKQHI